MNARRYKITLLWLMKPTEMAILASVRVEDYLASFASQNGYEVQSSRIGDCSRKQSFPPSFELGGPLGSFQLVVALQIVRLALQRRKLCPNEGKERQQRRETRRKPGVRRCISPQKS